MRILLINPSVREESPPAHFPLGLGYIASVLRKSKYDVVVLDIDGYRYNNEEVKNHLLKIECDIIGITGMISHYRYLKNFLVPLIRQVLPNKRIILGGGITTPYELVLKNIDVDIVVVGEGEATILNVLNNLNDLSTVDGIAYKTKEGIVKNRPVTPISDLDDIPFPAWELFPMEIYFKNNIRGTKKVTEADILTARGCPYNCGFCFDIYGKKVRNRSINNVISEITELKRIYGVNQISIVDETFILDKRRIIEFSKAMKALNITWGCNARVNLITDDLLKVMKEGGCWYMLFGIESGSQFILDRIGKNVTVEMAKNAVLLTNKYGINAFCSIMIGYIDEDHTTIQETVKFLKDTKSYSTFFYATATPETRLYQYGIKNKLIVDEDKYMENLTSFDVIHANFSKLSDAELIKAKRRAELEILINYILANKIKIIQKLPSIVKNIIHKYYSVKT
jgi:radical SAM superfamily enzyme YgiQ (UPF0313 family)